MSWLFFGGVDVGTGGREGHPAAISIVAVNQKFRKGKLYKFWRGNKYETTTTTDILNKYVELTKGLNMTDNRYDWHSKEFFLRAQAAGIPFNQADKARDFGFDLLNTLFRNQMLDIEDIGDAEDLVFELENLKQNEKKTTAIDDGVDSLRYCVATIPWDFSHITNEPVPMQVVEKKPKVNSRHENPYDPNKHENEWSVDEDIDEFMELMEGY